MKTRTRKPSSTRQISPPSDPRAMPHIRAAVDLVEAAKANLRLTMKAYYADRGEDAYIVFEDITGLPVPRLPFSDDGTPNFADGERLFDLAAAVVHFNSTPAALRMLWTLMMKEEWTEDADVAHAA